METSPRRRGGADGPHTILEEVLDNIVLHGLEGAHSPSFEGADVRTGHEGEGEAVPRREPGGSRLGRSTVGDAYGESWRPTALPPGHYEPGASPGAETVSWGFAPVGLR